MPIAFPSLSGSSTNFTFHAPCRSCACAQLPFEQVLLSEAKARVESNIRRDKPIGVDGSILIVLDAYAFLKHFEGDLSFLIPSSPVLNRPFHTQLHPHIQEDFEIRNNYVWDMDDMEDERPPLQIAGREAIFYPMFLKPESYTIIIFKSC